ncbi:MAG: hypothetical protein HQK75_17105 [Candidatus Magnetomorum sp.]|nr:hypothetical protein [Candidatus Magnetomorum sp.]
MTHFAYPNVKRTVFIGCGRFTSQESLPGEEYILIEKLNTGNIAEILDTAVTLSPGASSSGLKIYFKKDTPVETYVGDSQNLAYLLALIHCGRELKLNNHRDIWCTGSIEQSMRLKQVDMSGFEIKLKAFLSPKNLDKLFIVPAANIQAFKNMCHKQKARILLLKELKQPQTLQENLSQKKILAVHATELEQLVNWLFHYPPSNKGFHYLKIIWGILGIALLYLFFGSYHYLTKPDQITSVETRQICFYDFPIDCVNKFYDSAVSMLLFENLLPIQKNEFGKQCRCYSLTSTESLAEINKNLYQYLEVNPPNTYYTIYNDNKQLNVYFDSGFDH